MGQTIRPLAERTERSDPAKGDSVMFPSLADLFLKMLVDLVAKLLGLDSIGPSCVGALDLGLKRGRLPVGHFVFS